MKIKYISWWGKLYQITDENLEFIIKDLEIRYEKKYGKPMKSLITNNK